MGHAKDRTTARRLARARRHARIRRKVRGTRERPRVVVSRSLRHLEGQLVDDDRGVTILGVSTRASEVQGAEAEGKTGDSFEAGKIFAQRAIEKGFKQVVFDRSGYPYHGRVKAFAEGAREGGLEF